MEAFGDATRMAAERIYAEYRERMIEMRETVAER